MSIVPGELAEAIIGSLFIAIGIAAALAALTARPRRDAAALSFGVFCLLYGVRLASKSSLVQSATGWPEPLFQYVEAFVTYTILVPGGFFVVAVAGPGWHQLPWRLVQLTSICAVFAVVNALARGRPYASMWLNPPLVMLCVAFSIPVIFARVRSGQWSTEGRAVALASVPFLAVALYKTVSEGGRVFGQDFDPEPVAMLLFAGALGWFILARARRQTHDLVALSRELELARDIQQSLLPKQMPAVPGLRIQGAYLPMTAVAGDFYDVAALANGRIAVIVADVSGHGVPAALVASMVKVAFAAESERYERPGEILAGINRALTGKFERAYVTACCVAVDRENDRLAYSAAGHPPALLRRHDGRLERLDRGGMALTLLPSATYETEDLGFEAGDRLLVFTDGLLEATRGADDEFFGDAELERVVAAASDSEDLSGSVLDAYRRWIGARTPLSDDVTLVVVESVKV